jgi:hypothetical protein
MNERAGLAILLTIWTLALAGIAWLPANDLVKAIETGIIEIGNCAGEFRVGRSRPICADRALSPGRFWIYATFLLGICIGCLGGVPHGWRFLGPFIWSKEPERRVRRPEWARLDEHDVRTHVLTKVARPAASRLGTAPSRRSLDRCSNPDAPT